MLKCIIAGFLCYIAGHLIGSSRGFEKGYYLCFKDSLKNKMVQDKSIKSQLKTCICDSVYES